MWTSCADAGGEPPVPGQRKPRSRRLVPRAQDPDPTTAATVLAAALESAAPVRAATRVRTVRHGSMLHWCGWEIHAARRGPPLCSD